MIIRLGIDAKTHALIIPANSVLVKVGNKQTKI